MPQIGELLHPVTILAASTAREASGGEIPTLTQVVATRAKIEPLRGDESLSNGIQNATLTHRIWIRYRTGINPQQVIRFGSRDFEIVSVMNFHERDEWLEIMAKEGRA